MRWKRLYCFILNSLLKSERDRYIMHHLYVFQLKTHVSPSIYQYCGIILSELLIHMILILESFVKLAVKCRY